MNEINTVVGTKYFYFAATIPIYACNNFKDNSESSNEPKCFLKDAIKLFEQPC